MDLSFIYFWEKEHWIREKRSRDRDDASSLVQHGVADFLTNCALPL